MKQRPRIYYTEEQKAMMWDRWQKGETLGSIARLSLKCGNPRQTIDRWLEEDWQT